MNQTTSTNPLTRVLVTVLLQLATLSPAFAQLTDDPTTLPIPNISLPGTERALVVSVLFTSPSDLVVKKVAVANVRAPGTKGEPPMIKLELMDKDGAVIGKQNAWHPLLVFDWDEAGNETGQRVNSGEGTFYIPLTGSLAAVKIIDLELDQELIEVDVAEEVIDYCTSNATAAICDSFETPEPTATPTTTPSLDPTATPSPSASPTSDPESDCSVEQRIYETLTALLKRIKKVRYGKKRRKLAKKLNSYLKTLSEDHALTTTNNDTTSSLLKKLNKNVKKTIRLAKGKVAKRIFVRTKKRVKKHIRKLKKQTTIECLF